MSDAATTAATAATIALPSLVEVTSGKVEVATLMTVLITWAGTTGLEMLRSLVLALIIFIVGRFLAGWVRGLIIRVCEGRRIDATIGRFMASLAYIAVLVFSAISAMEHLGVSSSNFAAVLAAAGLAIGLAWQGSLGNLASGFFIVLFRPITKGDYISAGGVEGTVDEVQVFSTHLLTVDNKRLIVPNAKVLGDTITNFTVNPQRRVDLTVSIGPREDLERVRALLLAQLAGDVRILAEPAPSCAVIGLITGGTQLQLRLWVATGDYWNVHGELVAKVHRLYQDQQLTPPLLALATAPV